VQYAKVVEILDMLGRNDLNQIGLVTARLVK
jgi:biopolymer transport protein ExbD